MSFDVQAFLQSRAGISEAPSIKVLEGGYWNKVYRLQSEGIDWVVKCFYEEEARVRLYPNLPESEALALQVLGDTGIVPEFVDFFPKTEANPAVLIYEFAQGELWQGGITRVARLMRHYHQLGISELAFRQLAVTPGEILEQGDLLLDDCVQNELVRSVKNMRPAEKTISPLNKASLIHTDAWIGNFIGDKERLVLIDWQCPGLGDPAEDIWTFLYSGYQQLIGLPVYTRAEQQAFLDAYNNSDVFERLEQLSPYFAYRVAAHAVMRIQDLETTNPEGSSAYKIVLASLREHLNHD